MSGIFPDLMKVAEVVPLHMGKSPHIDSNYRLISLLTTMSKILEKVMYTQVYNFLDKTNQIYESQYGFRAKHSCEHVVSKVISEIVKNSEHNKYTVGLFLDLSKAFHTLDHGIVLKKNGTVWDMRSGFGLVLKLYGGQKFKGKMYYNF